MNKSIDSLNETVVSHFLGVDFGRAKIGLAIADEETKMAFALDTLKNDKDFFEKLKAIAKSKSVKTIIMGSTWQVNDRDSEDDEKRLFGEKIEKELGIAVLFHDEMFTTKMAQENIKMRGGKNIAKTDDQEAARIILQSWLDVKVGKFSHES